MGHTAVSATDPIDLALCSQSSISVLFATFNSVVDTKKSIIQMGPKCIRWLENESKPLIIF